MHPTAKRLYEVAERKLGTKKPSKVALELGISHQVLKNWETRGVSLLGLMASHSIWGCNPDWIQTGEGNMFVRQEAINSEETVLVDTGVCEFRVDAIYVFSIDNELFIKRLQRLPGGVYKAISDNHMYEAFELNHDFKIHGRVIYAWNGRKL